MSEQDRIVAFSVPGNPIPKGRIRRGANGAFYTPERTREYESEVQWRAYLAREGHEPETGPVLLRIRFYLRKARGAADLTNMCKAIEDGINQAGNIWLDDSQVVRLEVDLDRNAEVPRAEVEVYRLPCAAERGE